MKRVNPDPLQLAIWAADNLVFFDGDTHSARGAYLHWRSCAERLGVCAGTPNSFYNAMRKIGCPAPRVSETRRTRRLQNVSLAHHAYQLGPRPEGIEDNIWLMTEATLPDLMFRRYVLGEECRRSARWRELT